MALAKFAREEVTVATIDSSPAPRAETGKVRIGALGDIHFTKTPQPQRPLHDLLSAASRACDVLVLTGDLTDRGLPEEARSLAKEIHAAVPVPVVAVLGNHDFESGQQDEVCRILSDSGIRVLDGDACEFAGVGFAGIKGFCGGFGKRALGPWGEDIIKRFVHEAVEEALKLESALARLRMEHRIAVLHYSPIQTTVEGEPREIFPYLGSSRLEEPLTRYRVDAVFHGHAHRGRPEGKTAGGVPVYNVSLPVLERAFPDRPAFRVLEIEIGVPAEAPRPAHV
jgi:Icc-related predicted phosphoesterase